MSWLESLRAALAPDGLDLLGTIARERYDAAAPEGYRAAALHPPTRSIVVVASGGRRLWTRFCEFVAADPVAHLARRAHPLDDYCAGLLDRQAALLEGCRAFYPTFSAPLRLDFVKLGELAGLGRPSEIGILVGPRYGPWFALRAALFTPHALGDAAPIARLCDGCPAPCRRYWVSPASGATAHRAAREACVIAPEERYEDLQRLYHYDRAQGRRLLCERFGVRDELAGAS